MTTSNLRLGFHSHSFYLANTGQGQRTDSQQVTHNYGDDNAFAFVVYVNQLADGAADAHSRQDEYVSPASWLCLKPVLDPEKEGEEHAWRKDDEL